MGGRARAHPAPAVLGHGIRADPKSFFEAELGGDRGRTRQQTYVCKRLQLQTVCIYLAPPGPTPTLDPARGLPSRNPLCPR